MEEHLRNAIVSFVRAITGHSMIEVATLSRGFSSQTFAITTDTVELVAKVQAGEHTTIVREADVMMRCRDAAVPVPRVYGAGHLDAIEGCPAILLVEQVRGRCAEHITDRLEASELDELARQVARTLRILHRVPADHFGMLIVDDAAIASVWEDHVESSLAAREDDLRTIRSKGLLNGRIDDCRSMIQGLRYDGPEVPVVCHGDLGLVHVFVDNRLRTTGIIDFGLAQGNDGLLDLAVMTMFEPRFAKTQLVTHYFEGEPMPPNVNQRLAAHTMNIGIMHLAENLRRSELELSRHIASSLETMVENAT